METRFGRPDFENTATKRAARECQSELPVNCTFPVTN